MIKRQYPRNYNYKILYKNLIINRRFEGGMEYIAEKDNKYFLIIDESTLSEFVDDLDDILITIIEFEKREELEQYISKRKN
jgi:hypothetical protein